MQRCVYLGHVVGGGQVQPELSKLQAVEAFPRPKTKTQVRAFLELTGYYRRFIPDFATVAIPLTDLTKKSTPVRVELSEKCNHAFEELKHRLCKPQYFGAQTFHYHLFSRRMRWSEELGPS